MKNAAFFGDPGSIDQVYGQARRKTISRLVALHPEVIHSGNLADQLPDLKEIEVIFSTWGMPVLTAYQIGLMPRLKALFYAAGTVRHFARPLLERGITVMSAWCANAIPVAEFTVAQILLANKGYFRNTSEFRGPEANASSFRGAGNFGETVALLGAGAIGRKGIEFLRPFHLRVLVFDPFMTAEQAAELGVERVALEDAFSQGYVVSNHLANLPETVELLDAPLFARMRKNATFINTGRGATVSEVGLLSVFSDRSDLTALLDVTHPEPPAADSPLFTLPNIRLTTHIAGSLGDEVVRMSDYCIEDFKAWSANGSPHYRVTLEMLEHMS